MDHCFNKFFCKWIPNIFDDTTLSRIKPLLEEACMSIMNTFEHLTETDFGHLLKRSSNDLCIVNPMPTWLGKDYLNFLISAITKKVNKSLSLGVFPRPTKAALVKSLIKIHSLDIIF